MCREHHVVPPVSISICYSLFCASLARSLQGSHIFLCVDDWERPSLAQCSACKMRLVPQAPSVSAAQLIWTWWMWKGSALNPLGFIFVGSVVLWLGIPVPKHPVSDYDSLVALEVGKRGLFFLEEVNCIQGGLIQPRQMDRKQQNEIKTKLN